MGRGGMGGGEGCEGLGLTGRAGWVGRGGLDCGIGLSLPWRSEVHGRLGWGIE